MYEKKRHGSRNLFIDGDFLFLPGRFNLRAWLCMWLAAVFLSSCATPPPTEIAKSDLKNDFASGVSAAVDYISNQERTFIIVEISNSRQQFVVIWMEHRLKADGSETMKRDRIYRGEAKFISRNFRLPVVNQGVTETILYQVFDDKGARLMETEPIINTFQGGTS